MTIEEIQQQIVEDFEIFDEWMDKYQYLIDLSKNLPVIDDKDKTNDNLINGCQSRVWLAASFDEGKVLFKADSDAIITRGIVSLLIKVLSDRKPSEIVNADLHFIDKIGLKEHLSPTRSNGLVAMIKQIKLYALAYQSIENKQNTKS